jgi:translation initiation factor 1
MDLRDQLKNLFPDHEEQDFEMPEEAFKQKEPLVCKFEKKGRNGKPVTIVEGWEGRGRPEKNLKENKNHLRYRRF